MELSEPRSVEAYVLLLSYGIGWTSFFCELESIFMSMSQLSLREDLKL